MLGVGTDHKAGYVLNEKQRRRMAAAVLDKIRRLFSGLGIDDATESRRAAFFAFRHSAGVGNDSDKDPVYARRAADHFLCKVGLKFVYTAVIEERI